MILLERLRIARGKKLIEEQYIPVNAPNMKLEFQNLLSRCTEKMGRGYALNWDSELDEYDLETVINTLLDGFEPVKDVMES